MYKTLSSQTPFVFVTTERQGKAECIWSGETIPKDDPAVCIQSSSVRGINNVWLGLGNVEALQMALHSDEQLERKHGQSTIERRSPERGSIACCVCGESAEGEDAVRFEQNYSRMCVGEGRVSCHVFCSSDLAAILGRVFDSTDVLLGGSV